MSSSYVPRTSLWFSITMHGLLVALVGVLTLTLPRYATLTIEIVFGVSLLAVATLSIATYLSVMRYDGAEWILLWGLVAAVAGAPVLGRPEFAVLSLAIVLAAYFAVNGAFAIAAALQFRKIFTSGCGWVMVTGIINLLLAATVFTGLAENSMSTIGTLFGVGLIIAGSHLVVFGLMAWRRETAQGRPERY